MEQHQQGWSFQTPESMYASSQHDTPFAANVSTYFRRPTKIMKSTSRNASPRHSARRKTTTNVPISRTRSLHDRQRSGVPYQVAPLQQARPLSWHPNSQLDFDFSKPEYLQTLAYQNYFQPYDAYGTTSANGLVTPMSYAVADEAQIQELIAPLEELSAQENVQLYQPRQYNSQSWLDSDISKDQAYTIDNMFPHNHILQPWQWNHQTSMLDIPTAPASPDFLPIQGGLEASPLSLDFQTLPAKGEVAEDLVGMGLYDSPADVRSSSLLFGGGHGGAQKKQLKLEESFEPAPESTEAEAEGEGDDEEEEDQVAVLQQASEAVQFPAYQELAPEHQSTLAGQSFFFESEQDLPSTSNANMNYWVTNGYQPQYPAYGWI